MPKGWTRLISDADRGDFFESRWRAPAPDRALLVITYRPDSGASPEAIAEAARASLATDRTYSEVAFGAIELNGDDAWRWVYGVDGQARATWYLNPCGTSIAVYAATKPSELLRWAPTFRAVTASRAPHLLLTARGPIACGARCACTRCSPGRSGSRPPSPRARPAGWARCAGMLDQLRGHDLHTRARAGVPARAPAGTAPILVDTGYAADAQARPARTLGPGTARLFPHRSTTSTSCSSAPACAPPTSGSCVMTHLHSDHASGAERFTRPRDVRRRPPRVGHRRPRRARDPQGRVHPRRHPHDPPPRGPRLRRAARAAARPVQPDHRPASTTAA